MTPAPSLQDLIETVRRDADSDDILDQLAIARAMVSDMSETGDAVLGYYVDRARGSGRSWTEISNVLGVTKQAVHKRFAATQIGVEELVGDGPPTLERFTTRAKNTFDAATPAATGLGHNYVGTDHLLLGLYAEPEGIAGKILLDAGISREDVEADVISRTGRGTAPDPDTKASFTPRARSALTGSLAAAIKLGHNYIGTEHLLLGLYRDPEAIAPQILVERGLDAARARAAVIRVLSEFQKEHGSS